MIELCLRVFVLFYYFVFYFDQSGRRVLDRICLLPYMRIENSAKHASSAATYRWSGVNYPCAYFLSTEQ